MCAVRIATRSGDTFSDDDAWNAFCTRYAFLWQHLPRLASVFESCRSFTEFIHTGSVPEIGLTLAALTDAEWHSFSRFTELWCSRTRQMTQRYEFRAERAKRGPQRPWPSPFSTTDFGEPYLAIHFWAPWNRHDAEFDITVMEVIPDFKSRVTFRSLNIDLQKHHDFIQRSEVRNVPALGLFLHGTHHATLTGLLATEAIVQTLAQFITTNSGKLRSRFQIHPGRISGNN